MLGAEVDARVDDLPAGDDDLPAGSAKIAKIPRLQYQPEPTNHVAYRARAVTPMSACKQDVLRTCIVDYIRRQLNMRRMRGNLKSPILALRELHKLKLGLL